MTLSKSAGYYNDPQNAPIEWDEDEDDPYDDPYAELEAREAARERANEYKLKEFEP